MLCLKMMLDSSLASIPVVQFPVKVSCFTVKCYRMALRNREIQ